jgi:hypothetical protein
VWHHALDTNSNGGTVQLKQNARKQNVLNVEKYAHSESQLIRRVRHMKMCNAYDVLLMCFSIRCVAPALSRHQLRPGLSNTAPTRPPSKGYFLPESSPDSRAALMDVFLPLRRRPGSQTFMLDFTANSTPAKKCAAEQRGRQTDDCLMSRPDSRHRQPQGRRSMTSLRHAARRLQHRRLYVWTKTGQPGK